MLETDFNNTQVFHALVDRDCRDEISHVWDFGREDSLKLGCFGQALGRYFSRTDQHIVCSHQAIRRARKFSQIFSEIFCVRI
jgi:hypothetical protein